MSIHPNTYHNVIAGRNGMKLYTIYSQPIHSKNCQQLNKDDVKC